MTDKLFVLYLIGGLLLFFIVWVSVYWWYDAVCRGCRKRSPDFVWSTGHASKTYCEQCNPKRINEVYGNNLNYIEHLAKKKGLLK